MYTAAALSNLALNAENRVAIAREGGIGVLLELARTGSADEKEHAVWALSYLAGNAENRVIIAREGGIAVFQELLRTGTDDAKAAAAQALGLLGHMAVSLPTFLAGCGL